MVSRIPTNGQSSQDLEPILSSIFRAAPTGIGMVRDRVITHANERFCRMLGYSEEELLGKSARFLYTSDEEFEFVGAQKYTQIKEHGVGTVETCLRKKNGKTIDVLISSAPLDPNNLRLGVTFTALDITKRKQAEKRYREIVEGTDNIVTEVDFEGRFTFVNETAMKVFGLPPKECIGRFAFEFIHPDDTQKTQEHFSRWVKEKKPSVTFENRQISQTGKVTDILWTINFYFDDTGEIASIKSIGRNITERRKAEIALRKAHDVLEMRVEKRTKELSQLNESLEQEIAERKRAQEELEKTINELQKALNEIKTLHGIIPICANCKNIRDDKGAWAQMEKYISERSDAQFSHGICPECVEKLYPDLDIYKD